MSEERMKLDIQPWYPHIIPDKKKKGPRIPEIYCPGYNTLDIAEQIRLSLKELFTNLEKHLRYLQENEKLN